MATHCRQNIGARLVAALESVASAQRDHRDHSDPVSQTGGQEFRYMNMCLMIALVVVRARS